MTQRVPIDGASEKTHSGCLMSFLEIVRFLRHIAPLFQKQPASPARAGGLDTLWRR